jgi:hypothetical protein
MLGDEALFFALMESVELAAVNGGHDILLVFALRSFAPRQEPGRSG